MMSGPSTSRKTIKDLFRKKLKADTANFLKNGGKIKVISSAATAYSEDKIVFMKKTKRNKHNEHDAPDT